MTSLIPTILLVCVPAMLSLFGNVQAADFIFGGEAKRVCKAYKMICPAGKTCALQSLEWPRTMKFPVCVHERKIVVKSRLCRKPPQPGKCGAQFVRWYFNVHMGACSWFTYSGCGGNRNNFRTSEECERRCMGTAATGARWGGRSSQGSSNVVVEEGDRAGTDVDAKMNEGSREPITAPARAAEEIDLDVTSATGTGDDLLAVKTDRRAAEKRRRREQRRRARKERRRRRKEMEKRWRANRDNKIISSGRPDTAAQASPRPPARRRRPSRELTPLELGPNYGLVTAAPSSPNSWSSSASSGDVVISNIDDRGVRRRAGSVARDASRNFEEARGRGVSRYDPDRGEDRPIWMIDELLNQSEQRRERRRRRRYRNHNNRNNNNNNNYSSSYDRKPADTGTTSSKPTIKITVRSDSWPSNRSVTFVKTPTRMHTSGDTSSNRGLRSSIRTSQYHYNHQGRRRQDEQHQQPSDANQSDRKRNSVRVRDSPKAPAVATAGAPMTRPYYDKLNLFNILDDQDRPQKLTAHSHRPN